MSDQEVWKSVSRVGVALAAVALATGLTACGGGGGSSGGTTASPPPPPPPPPPAPTSVEISGQVTFDDVPFNTSTSGLNYNAINQAPARGVIVRAVNSGGAVLATDTSDNSGNYQLSVDSNTDVRIQVLAQIQQTTGATWDVQIVDNTSSNALYTLAGSLTSSGAANSTRNLNAGSGWGGSSYTGTRAAAPFAILDAMYDTIQDFAAVDGAIAFPYLQVFWSVNNRAANGNDADGDIGTSSYTRVSGVPTVKVLGDANSDTDEYDSHVVVHEFGHYFEDQISRSDSIGGSHSLSQRLDPRVAFGEGFGNALSGMILDDPFYRDSNNASQASGFSINVESNNYANEGWYNEGSIQSILYDIYDASNDGADVISGGLEPIYNTLTRTDYINNSFFTTIFAFTDRLRAEGAVSGTDLTALLAAQSINGTGLNGVGETNNAGQADTLPVYKTVTVGGGAVQVCSSDQNGEYNKLRNRAYLTFSIAAAGSYTLTMTRTSGDTERDPDFVVYQGQTIIDIAQDAPAETETTTRTLSVGEYVVDAYDAENTSGSSPGDSCYDFTVQ